MPCGPCGDDQKPPFAAATSTHTCYGVVRQGSASLILVFLALTFSADVLPALAKQVPAGSHPTAGRNAAPSGELSGRVIRPSGEPVSGATVVVENLESHERHRTLSTLLGDFRFGSLPPGEYRLLVTAAGYKSFSVPRLPLVAGDRAKAIALMEPGDISDVIEGSQASVVSRAGTALGGKSVSDLPENQRNFVNIVQVSRGANEGSTNNSSSSSRPGAQHQSSAVSLGGQPEKTNNSMIDGIDNNERINSEIALHPSVDAILEVEVLASAYPASFGRAGGGVINVITKSGGQRFHGALYEYFRNDVLDANPFQFGAQNPKPELRQNQFGGSLGGPLGRHRTYFFSDYEGFRLIQGRAPVKLTVPTAYEHAHPGDFTDVGGPLVTGLDPVGLGYFRLYPLPNVPGSINQFVSATNGFNFSHSGDLRLDQQITAKDQFFSRFSYNRSFVRIPGQFPKIREDGMTIEPGGSLTSFPGNMNDAAANVVFNYTHMFHSRLALTLDAGYTYWSEVDSGLNPHVAVNQGLGQPGINLPATSNGLAPINVLQAAPLGGDGYYRPIDQADSVFQYGGDLNWEHGNHTLRLGASLIERTWRNIGSGSGLGIYVVKDLPSLVAGQFLRVERQVDLANLHYRSSEPSTYVEDQWKLLPNVTLSLGLRYDIFTPPTEIQNRLSNFDLLTGRIIIAGQHGVSSTAGVRTDYQGVAPHFGFKWNMHGVDLSGGYRISYFRPIDTFVYKAQPFLYSFGGCSSLTCPGGFTSLAAGLPFSSPGDAVNPSGVLLGMRPFAYHNSYLEQFNLGIEEQHGSNTIRAFYVGSLGRHIARAFPDINAPPPNTAVNPNPLRPYYSTVPNLTSIVLLEPEASSSYHALQTSFAHAYHSGFTTQFNYTWAHGLDNTGAGQTGFGTVPALSSKLDYGNSSFDVRHRMTATIFYELPFGKSATGGRAWLIKAWQLNCAGVWSTGLPFTVLNATDVSNTNPGASAADRPNQIAQAVSRSAGVGRFFNTAAFVAQAPGTVGNERSNQLFGPHNRRLDASIFKNISLGKEANLQFRGEIFNLTNTANFAAPAAVLGGANFGQLTQMTAGYSPREVQLAVRLQF